TTGGTRSTTLSSQGTASRGAERPFRNVLTAGSPQTNTNTDSSTHGRHASQTARGGGPASLPSAPSAAAPAAAGPSSVKRSRGRQRARSGATPPIDRSADTTPPSRGPWKLEMMYWGTAKPRPATSAAGQTPRIPRTPASAATTQN